MLSAGFKSTPGDTELARFSEIYCVILLILQVLFLQYLGVVGDVAGDYVGQRAH